MHFNHRHNELYAEQVAVAEIARRWGTPCYIYSRAALEQQWHAFDQALAQHAHRVCYAVKANSNLAVLNVLARLGSGFDIVSGGELARVLAAGGQPQKIIFSGVGKQPHEIQQALSAGIYCFNVESSNELTTLNAIATQMQAQAAIAFRINPDISSDTHPYTATGNKENKFGIALEDALPLLIHATTLPAIKIIGIACHIGSQVTELAPFLSALDRLLALNTQLQQYGITIKHIDLGGGLGIDYQQQTPVISAVNQQLAHGTTRAATSAAATRATSASALTAPTPQEYCQAILAKLQAHDLELIIEPGRAIAARAGILLTRVITLKHTSSKNFAVVDAAMNDLIRPALYDAWQDIVPARFNTQLPQQLYDVVGPVCESGDFLGKDRHLALQEQDLLAIIAAGAYGFSMSSNYNTRPRAAEILVDGDQAHLVRRREEVAELFASEYLLP